MKKLIYLLSLIPVFCYSQNFEVTPNGLRDSKNLDNTYVVIEANGSTKQLFDKTVRYVNEKMASPADAVKGQYDSTYFRYKVFTPNFITYNNSGIGIPFSAKYFIELRFKNDKIRYEIVELEMRGGKKMDGTQNWILFSGGVMQGFIIYKKNGDIFKYGAKLDIETYFNTQLKAYISYLKSDVKKNDNW
jgi:hypothetical protein